VTTSVGVEKSTPACLVRVVVGFEESLGIDKWMWAMRRDVLLRLHVLPFGTLLFSRF
jgi:hypothetical protein